MKIIRFLSSGREHLGQLHDDGRTTLLEEDFFGGLRDTGKPATVDKLLAPLVPRDILCIGLNYKQHAAESGAEPPAHPVLFMKNSGTLRNPGDPIVLPRKLRSDEVDYECELAVVIGNTSDMIFNVPTLIEFLSASTILEPGTVILTGTPHGVGFARKPPVFLKAGDSVTIEIEGIGRLTNPVVEEAAG